MKIKVEDSKKKFFSQLRKHLKSPSVARLLRRKSKQRKRCNSSKAQLRKKISSAPLRLTPRCSFKHHVIQRAGEKLTEKLQQYLNTDEINKKRQELISYAIQRNKIVTASKVVTQESLQKTSPSTTNNEKLEKKSCTFHDDRFPPGSQSSCSSSNCKQYYLHYSSPDLTSSSSQCDSPQSSAAARGRIVTSSQSVLEVSSKPSTQIDTNYEDDTWKKEISASPDKESKNATTSRNLHEDQVHNENFKEQFSGLAETNIAEKGQVFSGIRDIHSENRQPDGGDVRAGSKPGVYTNLRHDCDPIEPSVEDTQHNLDEFATVSTMGDADKMIEAIASYLRSTSNSQCSTGTSYDEQILPLEERSREDFTKTSRQSSVSYCPSSAHTAKSVELLDRARCREVASEMTSRSSGLLYENSSPCCSRSASCALDHETWFRNDTRHVNSQHSRNQTSSDSNSEGEDDVLSRLKKTVHLQNKRLRFHTEKNFPRSLYQASHTVSLFSDSDSSPEFPFSKPYLLH